VFEEDNTIEDGDNYEKCWRYFVTDESVGVRNDCDFQIMTSMEVGPFTTSLDFGDVNTIILEGKIKTEEGEVLLELTMPDDLFKTSVGLIDRFYLKDHNDFCLDIKCDDDVGKIYGIMIPDSTAYREMIFTGSKIKINEGVGKIVIDYDQDEERTDVWIETSDGSKVTDAEDDYYSLFGSKFVDVNPGGGSFTIELANSRRRFYLEIGKSETTNEIKTLEEGESVTVGDTTITVESVD
ncbi:MAG: hypothetical protein ACTSPB_13335, partial [Candidatus Thorarchaeota archaeon]